ncbi:DUF3885 domain-containing protein [Actinopolymorpha pittospori]
MSRSEENGERPDAVEALERIERDLGWERPVLHGIGFDSSGPDDKDGEDGDGDKVDEEGGDGEGAEEGEGRESAAGESAFAFVRVDDHQHLLAAAALATATRWRGGTGSVRFGQAQLAEAIRLLGQSDAGRESPNLALWREIHDWAWLGGDAIAVFDSDPKALTDDPHVRALREVVASGRQDVGDDEVRAWPPPGSEGHPLQATWEAAWPGLAPISSTLRWEDDHWVRFHSLPGSKRYAETEEEYATVLHRHNTVLDELRAGSPELLVLTLEHAGTPSPRARTPILTSLLPDAECWAALSWPYAEPHLLFAHAYVSHVAWQPGRLDDLLRRVADGEVDGVIITTPDLAFLYAPYDGGADIVTATPARRDDLRDRYQRWLSKHPAGV